jgi:hypothetical protein
MARTLAEKIMGNFDIVKLKNANVAVPRLKTRKKLNFGKIRRKTRREISTSSIIGMLLKAASEKKGKEGGRKEISSKKHYKIIEEERPLLANAGYGTISKAYAGPIRSPYVDYSKIYGYLGGFRSKSPFEDFADGTPTQLANRVVEQGNKFYFVDREVIDSGVRNIKYFTAGAVTGEVNTVPVGINSSDWEKFKLWMKIDPVMFQLKMNTL